MSKIMIDGIDITEHVAAMFDAVVASLDWGSGFLATEDVESILIVGHLAGYDIPDTSRALRVDGASRGQGASAT